MRFLSSIASATLVLGLTGAALFASSRAEAQALVVAFGDSNTYGQGIPRGQDYPTQLEALLRAKGHNVRVSNAGVSGNTSADGLARLESAVPSGARVVVVQFGVNDARRGIPPALIEQNLSEMVGRIRAKGARVVLCARRGPIPPGYDVEAYRKVYAAVGKRHGSVPCNFTAGIPPSGFQPDGHENAEGAAVVARQIARLVEPMIRGR